MALETHPYGKTGEEVTVVGLGGGGLYKHSFAEGVATVRRALELGVTYFDTSPEYGGGMSHAILRDALDGRSEKYLLATKMSIGAPSRARSHDALRAQLDETLRLLARDAVDTLQVHHVDKHSWWTDTPPRQSDVPLDPDYDFAGAPVMEVLRDAKVEGLCRFIGITQNSFEGVARVLRNVGTYIQTYLGTEAAMTVATGYPLRMLADKEGTARIMQFCEVMANRLAARLAGISAEVILDFLAGEGLSKIEIDPVSSITFEEDVAGWTGYTDHLSINELQMCCDLAIAAFDRFGVTSHSQTPYLGAAETP